MMSEGLARRLFRQAGVSVLAGLLMSSAVLAGGIGEPVGEPEVAVEDAGDGGPDVGIDPTENDFVGIEPEEGTGEDLGEDPGEDSGDAGTDDIGTGEAGDGEIVSCDDCPDVTLDPIEWEGAVPVEDGSAEPGSEVPPEVLYATSGAPTGELIATGGALAARSHDGQADRRKPLWPALPRHDD